MLKAPLGELFGCGFYNCSLVGARGWRGFAANEREELRSIEAIVDRQIRVLVLALWDNIDPVMYEYFTVTSIHGERELGCCGLLLGRGPRGKVLEELTCSRRKRMGCRMDQITVPDQCYGVIARPGQCWGR